MSVRVKENIFVVQGCNLGVYRDLDCGCMLHGYILGIFTTHILVYLREFCAFVTGYYLH